MLELRTWIIQRFFGFQDPRNRKIPFVLFSWFIPLYCDGKDKIFWRRFWSGTHSGDPKARSVNVSAPVHAAMGLN
jgi:hypothetical protein